MKQYDIEFLSNKVRKKKNDGLEINSLTHKLENVIFSYL